jgi:hypothetical protein
LEVAHVFLLSFYLIGSIPLSQVRKNRKGKRTYLCSISCGNGGRGVGANEDDSKSVGLFPYILATISVNIFLCAMPFKYETRYKENEECAAKAIFYCPTMNSHRPGSQNTAKEQALIPEKDSKRIQPRCHVSLEKSSKNYKPLEK